MGGGGPPAGRQCPRPMRSAKHRIPNLAGTGGALAAGLAGRRGALHEASYPAAPSRGEHLEAAVQHEFRNRTRFPRHDARHVIPVERPLSAMLRDVTCNRVHAGLRRRTRATFTRTKGARARKRQTIESSVMVKLPRHRP